MHQTRRSRRLLRTLFVLLGVTLLAPLPSQAQLQWKSADEKMSFKIGLLAQMQGESIDVVGTKDTAQNLYFRRARILMGFNLGEKLSVFFDTDSPNLGKSSNAGTKDSGDVYIQDFVVSWKFSDKATLDGGMILPVTSYNHGQSAASLMPVDYGGYTFIESTPLQGRVGRDYGLQLRGYLADKHLEYRAGVFQGLRGTNSANSFRYVGRVMYSFFTPQVGLFYRGTSLGKTKTLSIGASYDSQEDYSSYATDFFFDLPIGKNGLTLQADLGHFDGDKFLTALPKQDTMLVEAGFYIGNAKFMPFVQYAERDYDAASRIDEDRLSFGIGYFINGHNNNIKLSYTKIEPARGDSTDQILLQWQVFQF